MRCAKLNRTLLSRAGVTLLCLMTLCSCALFKAPEQVTKVEKQECSLPASLTAPVRPLDPMTLGITNRELFARDARWEKLLSTCNGRLADVEMQYRETKPSRMERFNKLWGDK